MKFMIEQVALCPPDPEAAIKLLSALGLRDWVNDIVTAQGEVYGKYASNKAALSFNYQSPAPTKPLELEVLHYLEGSNWMDERGRRNSVSHLGMHCTPAELAEWRKIFEDNQVPVVQEVFTNSHTNPEIADKRRYHYVIFGTRKVLGVDLKFIVRYAAT